MRPPAPAGCSVATGFESIDRALATDRHRRNGVWPRPEVVLVMSESDPTPRSERPRRWGIVSDPSASARPAPSSDETDILRVAPPSAPVATGSGSKSSADRDDPVEPTALPNLGEKIDEFRLVESIGAGGMGAVFRAIDVGLDRQVALKILPPEQAVDPEVVRRYHQEGRAAARLDHENIARVYTIGDDGRYHYIAFEYIEGVTIRQKVLRDGPLVVADAIHFTLQIAHALIHAAEREVVHRDIKPSNIIITPAGRAKLVDMGLARQFERRGGADLTQTGMTLGTFDYISPEQARDPRDVDIRGDLYSLGCTLFHMLSGRPPFPEGTVLQKLLQHREDTPPDIRRLNPGVPDALAAILVKLLVKERDHRYQTPEHLARDLGAITTSRARALPSITPNSTPNWARHLFWGGPGLIFLLVLGGMVWWGDGPSGPNAPLGFRPPRVEPSGPILPSFRPGPASLPAKIAPVPLAEPIPPREVAVSPTDDLAEILAKAPPKSTIVLAERGPYELGRDHLIRLDERDLTIRAEVGVRPVIQLGRELGSPAAVSSMVAGSPTTAALVDIRGGRVTFDGIDFVVDASSFELAFGGERTAPSGPRILAAIVAEDAEVVVRRCSFRRVGAVGSNSSASLNSGLASNWKQAAIRLHATNRVASARLDDVASLVVDASDFDGHQIALWTLGPVDVSIRDVAFGPTLADQAAIWSEASESSATLSEFRLEHVNGLLGAGPMFRFSGTLPRVLARHSVFGSVPSMVEPAPSTTLVAIDTPDRLDWRGADNIYARVAVYLRPGGSRPQAPIRNFNTWADEPAAFRESGSGSFDGFLWERLPPTSQSLANAMESPRSFRLTLPRSVVHHPGARWGPSGPLPQPVWLTTSGAANRVIPPELPGVADRPANSLVLPSPPIPTARRPSGSGAEARDDSPDEMPTGLTPMPTDPDPPEATPASVLGRDPTAASIRMRSSGSPPLRPLVAGVVESTAIRSTAQFLDALKRDEAGSRNLIIAADAQFDLPSFRLPGSSFWTIRGERGPTRPRIRFRGDSPPVVETSGWSAWAVLRSGGLRLEGIDLILPASTALAPSREVSPALPWAAFAIRPGTADLVLSDCTVTIEGNEPQSVVVAVLPGDPSSVASRFDELLASPFQALAPTETRVRINDSLLRSAGSLIDVAPGRSVAVDLDNAVVASGGVMIRGHGSEEGRSPGSLRASLRRTTTRPAGGLIHLDTDRDHPNLPIASIQASDTIVAHTDPETPLIRVDGQGRPRLAPEPRELARAGGRLPPDQHLPPRRDQSPRHRSQPGQPRRLGSYPWPGGRASHSRRSRLPRRVEAGSTRLDHPPRRPSTSPRKPRGRRRDRSRPPPHPRPTARVGSALIASVQQNPRRIAGRGDFGRPAIPERRLGAPMASGSAIGKEGQAALASSLEPVPFSWFSAGCQNPLPRPGPSSQNHHSPTRLATVSRMLRVAVGRDEVAAWGWLDRRVNRVISGWQPIRIGCLPPTPWLT